MNWKIFRYYFRLEYWVCGEERSPLCGASMFQVGVPLLWIAIYLNWYDPPWIGHSISSRIEASWAPTDWKFCAHALEGRPMFRKSTTIQLSKHASVRDLWVAA